MIDEIINFLLGLIDGTYDNDEDINAKIKMIELEKLRYDLKRLRRK